MVTAISGGRPHFLRWTKREHLPQAGEPHRLKRRSDRRHGGRAISADHDGRLTALAEPGKPIPSESSRPKPGARINDHQVMLRGQLKQILVIPGMQRGFMQHGHPLTTAIEGPGKPHSNR